MASSSWALAVVLPPNQLRALPWAKRASTSRGCTAPLARTNSSTAAAWRSRSGVQAVRGVRGCISAACRGSRKP